MSNWRLMAAYAATNRLEEVETVLEKALRPTENVD